MPPNNDELMPCPFCQAGETRIDERHHSPTMSGAIKEPISVTIRHWCPKKEGQPSGLNFSFIGRDRASAIAAWNTRATPPPSGDAVRVAVETIEGLSANVEVLLNVINDPTGGSPLAKHMILMIARNTVEGAKDALSALRALPADQGDEDAAKALDAIDRSVEAWKNDELEAYYVVERYIEHRETIRAALQQRGREG